MNIGKYLEMYSEDLRLKNYSANTIDNYVSQVKCFLEHFDKQVTKPSEINERMIKTWLLLANTVNSRKHRISAVKLFYNLTGKQPLKFRSIEYPRTEKKLPIVLSTDEIQKMFSVCQNSKHRAVMALLYSAGLRVGELIHLKWAHIDRSRMVINIIGGKGKKDRQVMLSESLIGILTTYYKEFKPKVYVFNGQNSEQYSERSVNQLLKHYAEKAGIKKRVYAHLMRHNAFTHMVEAGTDINLIQKLAGHSNVKTTLIYTHISDNLISKIKSPLDNLKL